MILMLILFTAFSEKIVEYRFSTNYGNFIYDHSGNGVTGIIRNSQSLSPDAIFTDRGFYITSKISIAPLKSGMVQMPNPGTILMWTLTDSTEGRLMHSISNNLSIFHFKLFKISSDRLKIQYFLTSTISTSLSTSTFISNEWVLLSITLSDTRYIFRQNSQTLTSIDMGSKINYSYWLILGYDLEAYTVVNGFIWYYAVVDYENAHNDFIGSSYQTCFLEFCSSCTTFVYDDNLDQSGCISVEQDPKKDAKGIACLTTKSCRDSRVIECLCKSESCSYESIDKVWCIQLDSHEFLRSSAICDQVGQGCCLDICSECSNMTACLTCFEANAFVDDDGLCSCNSGYFGNRPLNFTGSCLKCPEDCLECDNSTICTVCIDQNAYPTVNGCVCKNGFWSAGNTSLENNCKACNSECKTCSNNTSCIECATEGTIYINDQGCCLDICLQCSNETSCTACLNTNAFVDSDKLCSCEAGYFGTRPLNSTDSCLKCPEECSECNNSTICTFCLDQNAYPTLNGCVCKEGFWSAGNKSLLDNCKTCKSECKSCINNSSCIECATEGTYFIDGQGCCLEICLECSNETTCTACLADHAFVDDDGICSCESGYYGERPLKSLGSCSKCADECLECENPKICTKCTSQNLYPTPDGCMCKDGYWPAGNKSLDDYCKICSNECKTCINDHSCIECRLENSSYINGKCECIDGFKLRIIGDQLICTDKCFEGCSLCEGGECKQCLDLNTFLTSDNECKCKAGYFKNDSETSLEKVCAKCPDGCKSCSSYSECNSCYIPFTLNNNSCMCKPGYYIENSINNENLMCVKCKNHCEECLNDLKCILCKKSYTLVEDKCICMPGFREEKSVCKQNYFECSLSINKENIIKLTFNEPLQNAFKYSEIKLVFENSTGINFVLYKSSKKLCILGPKLPRIIGQNITVLVNLISYPIFSIKNSLLREYLYEELLNEIQIEGNSTSLEILNDSFDILFGVSVAAALILNPKLVFTLLNTLEIIKFLPLTTNEMTPEIRKICKGISIIYPVPNLLGSFMNQNSSSNPIKEVQDCGINYSPFILNSGKGLVSLVVLMAIFPFICLIYNILKNYSQTFCKNILKAIKYYRYNLFIRFFLQIYLTFGVYAIVQIKSVSFIKEKLHFPIEYYFNQISAMIFIVIFSITPWVLMVFLCVKEKDLESRELTFIERYGTLFSELKTEKGLRFSIFWVLFTLRRVQYLLAQFFMNFNHTAQISLSLGKTIFLIGYLAVFRPLRSKIEFFYLILSEVCIGICFALVLFLLFFNSEESKKIINNIFLYTIIGYLGIYSLISIIMIFFGFRKKLLSFERKRAFNFVSKALNSIIAN